MSGKSSPIGQAAVCAPGTEAPTPEYAIHGVTDKEVAIYQPGEAMTFTLRVLEDGKPVATVKANSTSQ